MQKSTFKHNIQTMNNPKHTLTLRAVSYNEGKNIIEYCSKKYLTKILEQPKDGIIRRG